VGIDRPADAESTAATAESDAAGSLSALERAQNEHVADVGQQTDSAQPSAAGSASRVSEAAEPVEPLAGTARSESAENEADAASRVPVDAVQGEVVARVDDARETARDLAAATPGPVPEETKYVPPRGEQKDAVRGEMVARVDSVDPTQSSTQRAVRSEPKETSTSPRTSAARDRDSAQQASLPGSQAKRPSENTLTGYTQRFAERKLLSMWGVNSEPPPGADFCQYAQRNGLNCLKDGRGLKKLYVFNRPAIIALKVGDLDSYGLVTKATPDEVVLNVLDRQHVIPANVLPKVWDGRFLVLWRGPNGLKRNLVKGATGQPVVQLRKIVDQIDGRSTSGDVYDAELVARVKQFQSDVGLTPDGIVGPRTQIVMQNKLAEIEKK
jgi:general secretion pathway protein A